MPAVCPTKRAPDGWDSVRLMHTPRYVLYIHDVYKKPYTFLLKFPHNLAFIVNSGGKAGFMKKRD